MAISGQTSSRRASNAKALTAFGISTSTGESNALCKVVREGGAVTLFTVGYEGRSGEDLMAILRDAGIEHLADIRDKPMSRKPDFRAKALMGFCEQAGIEYGAWPDLGSTREQRDRLHATGDLAAFHKTFPRICQTEP